MELILDINHFRKDKGQKKLEKSKKSFGLTITFRGKKRRGKNRPKDMMLMN